MFVSMNLTDLVTGVLVKNRQVNFPREGTSDMYVERTSHGCQVMFNNGRLAGKIVYNKTDLEELDRLEHVLEYAVQDLLQRLADGTYQVNFEKLVDQRQIDFKNWKKKPCNSE